MRSKNYASMKVEMEAKKRLDAAQKLTKSSFSAIILRYVPPEKDIWKEELANRIDELKGLFPRKRDLLESFRYVLLYSEELPDDLKDECTSHVERALNDLSHYVVEQRKRSVLPKGRTQKNGGGCEPMIAEGAT